MGFCLKGTKRAGVECRNESTKLHVKDAIAHDGLNGYGYIEVNNEDLRAMRKMITRAIRYQESQGRRTKPRKDGHVTPTDPHRTSPQTASGIKASLKL